MTMKGNPSAAQKKPSYGSNASVPKGSDSLGQNKPGQYPNEPMNMTTKSFSPTKQTQAGKE